MLVVVSSKALAVVITADQNGNWNAPGTWDLNRVPQCGDTIVIPAAFSVHVAANVNLDAGGCAPVTIIVSGRITFANGRKIRLNAGGCMQIQLNGQLVPSGVGGGSSEVVEINSVDWWKAADGTLTGATGGTFLGCGMALPVELVAYSISYINEQAHLEFETASERDVTSFSIEISRDGAYWQELETVQPKGTSSTGSTYTVIDKSPFMGTSYYRLSQKTINGNTVVLQIISGEFNTLKYLLYPVPVNKLLFVEGDHLESASMQIISSLGEVVPVEGTLIGDKMQYDCSELKSGVYFLTIESNQQKKTERIVVVHK